MIEHLKDNAHLFCESSFYETFLGANILVGVDVTSGAVFCSTCDDIVHSHTLDRVYLESNLSAEEKRTGIKPFVSLKTSHSFVAFSGIKSTSGAI